MKTIKGAEMTGKSMSDLGTISSYNGTEISMMFMISYDLNESLPILNICVLFGLGLVLYSES